MAKKTPFDVLEVAANAEFEVIKAAFHALAKKYHPDVQRGMDAKAATRRMAELNWAWEELQRDLSGWRIRAGNDQTAESASTVGQTASATRDYESWWQEHVSKYRRPKDVSLDWWRKWFGTDVTCRACGCVLTTYVYKCPDCGAERTWKRSILHTFGHRMRLLFWVPAYIVAVGFAVTLMLGLLMIAPMLVLEIIGLTGDGAVHDWHWWQIVLLILGVMVEVVVIWAVNNWELVRARGPRWWDRAVDAVREYWET